MHKKQQSNEKSKSRLRLAANRCQLSILAGYRDLCGFAVTGLPLSSVLLGEQPRLPSTTRVERPQLYRGGSVSTKGHLAAPPHPSKLAHYLPRDGG